MSDPRKAALAARLRAARESAGMSVPALARAAGLSRSAVNDYDHGRCVPSVTAAFALAAALGVGVEELFGDQCEVKHG